MSHAAFAAALLDPDRPCPPGLRAWNGSDPARRFAVHRNNVLVSLVDALADSFPVVLALVGEPFFRAMAAVFVRQQPPRSPLLALHGTGFPSFIRDFDPAAGLPYLADVARLELARLQACHAADAAPLAADAAHAALACGARVGELRLQLHPAVRLLASPHAIVSIWAAHQGEGEWGGVDPQVQETALVVRPGLEVLVLRCDAGTAAFVAAIQQGLPLAGCAAAAADCPGFDLTATLTLLLAHGALAALQLPSEELP